MGTILGRPPNDFADYLRNYHIRMFPRAIGVVFVVLLLYTGIDYINAPGGFTALCLIRLAFTVPILLIYLLGFRLHPNGILWYSLAICLLLGFMVTALLPRYPPELFQAAFILGYFTVLFAAIVLFPLQLLEYFALAIVLYLSYVFFAKYAVPHQSPFLFAQEDRFFFAFVAIGVIAHILRQKGMHLGYQGECYRHSLEAANVELKLQSQEMEELRHTPEERAEDRSSGHREPGRDPLP